MANYIGLTTVLIRDYDEAISWYTQFLGFEIKEDKEICNGNPLTTRRWVVVGPKSFDDKQLTTGILLSKADGFDQLENIGKQTCEGVAFYLFTDDFNRDYEKFKETGVWFNYEPRIEIQGLVCDFKDLYDNIWQLIERVPKFA
uniref:VOC domain-containing protein n=1 Tax=Acrobeloides nanus TaxID=290746 RepID=A0A914DXQ8_9BILA